MTLKQNSRLDYQYPIRYLAGALLGDRPGCNVNGEMNEGDFSADGFSKLTSTPNGYVPPYCLYPAMKSGGLASFGRINGTGVTNTPIILKGINVQSIITGSSVVSSDIQGIGWCVTYIDGNGDVTNATCAGSVFMEADISGAGDITYIDLRAVINLLASIGGSSALTESLLNSVVGIRAYITSNGTIYSADLHGGKYITSSVTGVASVANSDLRGKGNISSYIIIGESVKPSAQDIANAVWDTTVMEHITIGSTGKKLTEAAAGGDPWGTSLPGSYTSGTAGFRLGTGVTVDVSEIDAALTSSHGSGSWVVTSGSGGGTDLTSSVGKLVWAYGSRSVTNARFDITGSR